MGKGGYIGGHIQLGRNGSGFSYDDADRRFEYEDAGDAKWRSAKPASPVRQKGKRPKASSSNKTLHIVAHYNRSLTQYAKECAENEKRNKPWGTVYKAILKYHNKDELAAKQAVRSSEAYKTAKSEDQLHKCKSDASASDHLKKRTPKQPAYSHELQRNGTPFELAWVAYCKACASAERQNKDHPVAPDIIKEKYRGNLAKMRKMVRSSSFFKAVRGRSNKAAHPLSPKRQWAKFARQCAVRDIQNKQWKPVPDGLANALELSEVELLRQVRTHPQYLKYIEKHNNG